MLTAEEVCLCYGEHTVFHNLNITLHPGDDLVIVGKSGCGKSSLLYVMSGLRKPSSGVVVFNGVNLWRTASMRAEIRRRSFGFIFQQHFLINYLTALENVLVPSYHPHEDRTKALSLLAFLGLEGYESRFPYELSGGMRQRVAIARALINEPAVIFADEPTASLDEENSQLVIDLLQAYRSSHNTCLIMVTHQANLAVKFSRSLQLPA